MDGIPAGFKHERDPKSPSDALQGKNSIGNVGYDGPLGSVGQKYRYRFTLFALDEPLQMDAGATKEEFLSKAANHVIDEAQIITEYERKRA